MAGRDPLPGESDSFNGHRDHARYHSRIVRGQIKSSTPEDGTIQVATIDIAGVRNATVPPLWFSASGRKSAWGRFMPGGNEHVHVAYRNDDTPVILGYDIKQSGTAEGWEDLKEFEESGVPGFATFRKLKPYEFDFKSGGDAYIHGSNQGTLFLSGGQAFIKLEKQAYRISSKASTYLLQSGACGIRLGTVFRKILPTDTSESPVNMGVHQEFLVDVNQALPIGIPSIQSKAKLHFGDVLQEITNIPEISLITGQPLRGKVSIGDPSNTQEVFKLEIDQLGNVVWNQGSLGVMGLTMRAQTLDIEAMLDARFNGLTITLGAPGSDEPLVLGNKLVQALTDLINNVFLANAAFWGVGNLSAPVPLAPPVVAALNTWLANNLIPTVGPFLSLKAFTEQGP